MIDLLRCLIQRAIDLVEYSAKQLDLVESLCLVMVCFVVQRPSRTRRLLLSVSDRLYFLSTVTPSTTTFRTATLKDLINDNG